MRMFNHWARTVGSILAYVGVPGFLGNLHQLYEIADETVTQWETFLQAWLDTFGSRVLIQPTLAPKLHLLLRRVPGLQGLQRLIQPTLI